MPYLGLAPGLDDLPIRKLDIVPASVLLPIQLVGLPLRPHALQLLVEVAELPYFIRRFDKLGMPLA